MRWRRHDEDVRTWEPLLQLCEDVPVLVEKYVTSLVNATLTQEHADYLAMLAADPDPDTAPETTTMTTTAQRVTHRSSRDLYSVHRMTPPGQL